MAHEMCACEVSAPTANRDLLINAADSSIESFPLRLTTFTPSKKRRFASVREASNSELIKEKIAALCSVTNSEITSLVLLKRSIDARARTIKVTLRSRVSINADVPTILPDSIHYSNVATATPVLIICAGPA